MPAIDPIDRLTSMIKAPYMWAYTKETFYSLIRDCLEIADIPDYRNVSKNICFKKSGNSLDLAELISPIDDKWASDKAQKALDIILKKEEPA